MWNVREEWETGVWGALIVNTTVFCYSYHSFHWGSGSVKFTQPGLHRTKPEYTIITSVFIQRKYNWIVKYVVFYFFLFYYLNQQLPSACLSLLLSLRIPASVLDWHYFEPSSHPFSLPSLALLSHSGQIPSSQHQAVPANPSPSQRHSQPLASYPASLTSPLLSPHPCQFWLITQTKRPLLPPQASHEPHARKRGKNSTIVLQLLIGLFCGPCWFSALGSWCDGPLEPQLGEASPGWMLGQSLPVVGEPGCEIDG